MGQNVYSQYEIERRKMSRMHPLSYHGGTESINSQVKAQILLMINIKCIYEEDSEKIKLNKLERRETKQNRAILFRS